MTYIPVTCHNCKEYGTTKCPDCFSNAKENDVVCMEHPRIREYLMLDVLQELERRRKGNPTSAYVEGMFDGYDEAIELIKNGVKK